jgi:Rad3-related DNA helicase
VADPFTPEQMEALDSILGKHVNSAILARTGNIEKSLDKKLGAAVEGFTKSLDERLATLKPAEPNPDESRNKTKRGDENTVEMQTVKKEVGDLRKQLEDANRKASDAERKQRTMQLRSQVTDALNSVGITQHARLALSVLVAEGRVAYGGDVGQEEAADELLFNDEGGAGWVKLDSGLKSWAKTPDAKLFLSPSGANGAGTRPPIRRGDDPPTKLSDAEKRTGLGNALKDLL